MTLSQHNILTSLKGVLRRSTSALLVAVLCLPAAMSCSETEEVPETQPSFPTEDTRITAGITLTVTTGNISRAAGTIGPDYDTGAGYENYIDIENGDFRFYFFDADDNTFIAPFNIEILIPQYETVTSKRYIASGKIDREFADRKDLVLVALANWKTYPAENALVPGVTTIEDICSRTYDFTTQMMELSDKNTIPLYGVTNILNPIPRQTNSADLGKIHLLRAFAKIEVNRYEGGFEIDNVKLRRYSSRGFCAPTGIYRQNDYVHGNYEQDYANTPHIPAGAYTDKEIPFVKVNDDMFVAYVPEFDNLADAARRSTIAIQFRATNEPDIIEFKYYDGPRQGQHFNILRNYWYRFDVRKKGVIVQVVPYSEIVLNPIFGLDSNLELVEIDIDGVKYYYDRETGKFYDENLRLIDNPYFGNVDPVTGWYIQRDDNNLIINYYDQSTGYSYAINKITRILNPVNNRDEENENLMKIQASFTGNLLYYHDKTRSILLATDKTTEIQNPFDYYDKTDNIVRYVSRDRKWTYGYFSMKDNAWYAPDRTTVIADPFAAIDPDTKRIKYTNSDGSKVYGYYSIDDNKWYNAASGGSEIKNPF